MRANRGWVARGPLRRSRTSERNEHEEANSDHADRVHVLAGLPEAGPDQDGPERSASPEDVTDHPGSVVLRPKSPRIKNPKLLRAYARAHMFCEVCGGHGAGVHHKVHRSQGGGDVPGNLITLCQQHHNEAHGIYERRP